MYAFYDDDDDDYEHNYDRVDSDDEQAAVSPAEAAAYNAHQLNISYAPAKTHKHQKYNRTVEIQHALPAQATEMTYTWNTYMEYMENTNRYKSEDKKDSCVQDVINKLALSLSAFHSHIESQYNHRDLIFVYYEFYANYKKNTGHKPTRT